MLTSNNLFYSFINSFIIHVTSSSSYVFSPPQTLRTAAFFYIITVHIPEYCVHHIFKIPSKYTLNNIVYKLILLRRSSVDILSTVRVPLIFIGTTLH